VFTKAAFATHVASMARLATIEASELAQGMWNPMFCSNDASDSVRRFCEEMQSRLDNLQEAAARLSKISEEE
jgi:hypothetical protein